jgi:transcription antitermination factor NusG
LTKDVKELKEKVKEATEELETLKGDHIKLILGPLAFEVEKAISINSTVLSITTVAHISPSRTLQIACPQVLSVALENSGTS